MNLQSVDNFASGEEGRLVLADAAARAERRNKPRFLLVASGGLVIIALVWLIAAFWSQQSASELLLRERGQTISLQKAVHEYTTEKKRQQEILTSPDVKPDASLQANIEDLGRRAGLSAITISVGDDSFGGTKSLQRKRFSYAMNQPQETEAIFAWIHSVQAIPGIELANIDIEPAMATVEGKARWKGTIAFTRWEVKGN